MSSFFEKLKKGMDIEKPLDSQENLEQDLSRSQSDRESPDHKAIEDPRQGRDSIPISSRILDEVGTKSGSEEPTPENKKPSVEKPPVILVSNPVSSKKTIKKDGKKKVKKEPKMKKINPIKSSEAGPSPSQKGGVFNRVKVEKEQDRGRIETLKEKRWFEPEGELTVDVYQTDKEIVIQSAVAGVKPEDLDISIENDVIIIKGIREKFLEEEKKNYFYQECYWGRFSRKIISPVEIDGSRAKALMKNGILTIRIPKIEREKKRKVIVEK